MMYLNFLYDLKKHLRFLKIKDERAIKRANYLLNELSYEGIRFSLKLEDIYNALESRRDNIATVIRMYVDNEIVSTLLNTSYSDSVVRSILADKEFIASLLCSSLLKRTANLSFKSAGQLKMRIYIAILNFDSYKKNLNSREE